MFNLFGPRGSNGKWFLSYRNIRDESNDYPNYELALRVVDLLEETKDCNTCITIKPEAVPYGTLFSPYDIVRFLNVTFIYLDSKDHFVILNKDYFEDDKFTSVWTQAECLIWSYYGRDMFLGQHNNKDKFFTLATPDIEDETTLSLSEKPLLELDEYTRYVISAASFHNTPNRRMYSKLAYLYFFTCEECEESSLISEETIKEYIENNKKCSCPNCNSRFTLSQEGEYFVAQPSDRTTDIISILDLLFAKNTTLSII